MAKESICRNCFHSYVCEQFNENKDENNEKCHFFNDHYTPTADVVPREEVSEYVSTEEPVRIARAVQLAAEAARANGYKQGATDTARAFAERLITYYKNLNGTTSPALAAYHVEQVLKDFINEKENT